MSCLNISPNATCSAGSCLGPFTGDNCSTLTCSNAILPPQGRNLSTNGACASCDEGWGGIGCNVCTSNQACQNAVSANSSASGNIPTSGTLPGGESLSTVVCNTAPRVYTSGSMTCDVDNPTVKAVFSGTAVLAIQKTVGSSSSSLSYPYTSGISGASAQLWYTPSSSTTKVPIEQFYCAASTCSQTTNTKKQLNSFVCKELSCRCIAGTDFCGGGGLDLTNIINGLNGELTIDCSTSSSNSTCAFKQEALQSLFGPNGLTLSGCGFGECVFQSVIESAASDEAAAHKKELSPGVIVGLAIVGVLIGAALLFILLGWIAQRKARRAPITEKEASSVGVRWENISYSIPTRSSFLAFLEPTTTSRRRRRNNINAKPEMFVAEKKGTETSFSGGVFPANEDEIPLRGQEKGEKQILSNVSGYVPPGQMLAILGASGTGKSTLLDILSCKRKAGRLSGDVYLLPSSDSSSSSHPTIAFVDQNDVLPSHLTVREALAFAANLKLPDNTPRTVQDTTVWEILEQLGLKRIAESKIGDGERRGISGGERRRLSIGMELLSKPNVLFLDEPTSGLDSAGAANVVHVLRTLAKENGTTIIASIHQPSSQIFHAFDRTLLLGYGKPLYCGPTESAMDHFAAHGYSLPPNYNPADYLLEISCGPNPPAVDMVEDAPVTTEKRLSLYSLTGKNNKPVTTMLTQFETIGAREIYNLRRDWSLIVMHNVLAIIIGVFVGGLFYQVNDSISGFQNRVGSLFFLGSLIAFSSLSALSNFVSVRELFLKERSAAYYSPISWLLSRIVFDIVPLRVIPTILLAIIVYFMVGLAKGVASFFKYLLVLVLFNIVITFFALTLAATIRNGGTAILVAGVLTLFQMAYAGFFINIASITPVLRWLQYISPLRYALEALTVNEVGTGLQIRDTLQGVDVNISGVLIMRTLFGFDTSSYARNVVVLFAWIVLFAICLTISVLFKLRELR
ncbi:hypothetical protein BT69DRAFT_1316923 [Atractiella rhizophila]|nr:hypothetical protein BT69DRAFT_1316923 [Atractiella rhizophila]